VQRFLADRRGAFANVGDGWFWVVKDKVRLANTRFREFGSHLAVLLCPRCAACSFDPPATLAANRLEIWGSMWGYARSVVRQWCQILTRGSSRLPGSGFIGLVAREVARRFGIPNGYESGRVTRAHRARNADRFAGVLPKMRRQSSTRTDPKASQRNWFTKNIMDLIAMRVIVPALCRCRVGWMTSSMDRGGISGHAAVADRTPTSCTPPRWDGVWDSLAKRLPGRRIHLPEATAATCSAYLKPMEHGAIF